MPWQDDTAWDDAIEGSPEIAVGGTRTDDGRRSTEFLHRPGQLLCDTGVWTNPRDPDEEGLRARLDAVGAAETRGEPRLPRDDQRAEAADRLGLTLLNVPGDELPELVRAGRQVVPDAFAFNHVVIANPQRFGGCAPPQRLDHASVQIGGVVPQQGARTVAVLDTGIVENAPFAVHPDSDVEPAGAGGPAAGHGTMVAGVVARYAPAASVLVKRVLNLPLGDADELEIAAALAALPEVDIVNASFGGPAAEDMRMVALERALDALPPATLVVASAGNEGLTRPEYTAAFKRVLGVASAGDVEGDLAVFPYSNRGRWVDLSTQGTDVETVAGADDPVLASGSSFAAPKIAARVLEIAERDGVGVRHAASWLMHESGGPAIAGGGTFVDMPTP